MVRRRTPFLAARVVSFVLALGIAACGSQSTPTAPATVASVAVNGTAPGAGASAPFSATATLSDGTTQIVTSQATWTSSNTSVATVSAGTVSGLRRGSPTSRRPTRTSPAGSTRRLSAP